MRSTFNEIGQRIETATRGTLFFPDDFVSMGTSDAIRAALTCLCRSKIIVRVAHGIYYYPKIDTK